MLHPRNDRVDYGKLLMPPDGYTLTKAIGTTYSLDLDALMIMPVAMFYSESIDRPKNEIRVDMVDAIVNATNKIAVYYQQGKLQVPKKYHFLRAFWEKHIHEIRMPEVASSFHPKVWIIRFDNILLPAKYRLIVTSRNLTFANDYDIAFSTEGNVDTNNKNGNQELVDFIIFLNSIAFEADTAFIEDLRKVIFEVPAQFSDLVFYPIGIPSKAEKFPNPIFSNKWEDLLIISPFLDNSSIDHLAANTVKRINILSVQEEISCIKNSSLVKSRPWQFSKYIEQSSLNDEIRENVEDPLPQSLHAKIYIGLFDKVPYWYMGSANCTSPAQERNIEFLIELRAIGKNLKPVDILSTLTDASNKATIPLFETFQPCDIKEIDAQKKLDFEIRKILYSLFERNTSGNVAVNILSNLYTYNVKIDLVDFSIPTGFSIEIKPVSKTDEISVKLIAGVVQEIRSFSNYAESFLTPYFAVYVYYNGEKQCETTWIIDIDLPSTRLSKIFTAIIQNRERFMQYLFFLLNGHDPAIIDTPSSPSDKEPGTNEEHDILFDGRPIFENLLIAASRYPDKLTRIKELVLKLKNEDEDKRDDEKIISAEFLSFWEIFDQVINKSKMHA